MSLFMFIVSLINKILPFVCFNYIMYIVPFEAEGKFFNSCKCGSLE